MRECILIYLFSLIKFLNANYNNYTMVFVEARNELDIKKLLRFESSQDIQLLDEPGYNKPGELVADPKSTTKLFKFLNENGFKYSIKTRNLQQYLNNFRSENLLRSSSNSFEKYNTYDEIKAVIQEMAKSPGVTTKSIGKTVEGREIPMIQINVSPNKSAVVLECGIHAREWIAPATCLNFANNMIKRPCDGIKKVSLYIIPTMNPDGYVYSHTTNRMHRKNRGRPNPVDLNRNFPSGWKSVLFTRSATYGGPKPFSEPEAQAFKKVIEDLGDNLIFHVAIHSYSQLLLTPYCYKNANPENKKLYDRVIKAGYTSFKCENKCHRNKRSKYIYKTGATAKVLYKAYGDSGDWIHESSKSHKKVSICIELPDKGRFGFLLPARFIPPVNQSFTDAVCAMVGERIKTK